MRVLHLSRYLEYHKNELEYFDGVEGFRTCDKSVLVNHLHIQDVIDEAEEEVYLGDYDKSHLPHGFVQVLHQESLEDHENVLEW